MDLQNECGLRFQLIGLAHGQIHVYHRQPPPLGAQLAALAPAFDAPLTTVEAMADTFLLTLWLPHSGQVTWASASGLLLNTNSSNSTSHLAH